MIVPPLVYFERLSSDKKRTIEVSYYTYTKLSELLKKANELYKLNLSIDMLADNLLEEAIRIQNDALTEQNLVSRSGAENDE